jgi:hypothetical protein
MESLSHRQPNISAVFDVPNNFDSTPWVRRATASA